MSGHEQTSASVWRCVTNTLGHYVYQDKGPEGQRLLSACERLMAETLNLSSNSKAAVNICSGREEGRGSSSSF
ncbi:hypothetical protein PAMP_020952 [Pampus punctatissimus]